MKFALLYSYDPGLGGPVEGDVALWMDFDQEIREANGHVYEAGFQPASTGRTVSVRSGKTIVEDGATTDGGNEIAGVWVIDVPAIEDAVAWAQKIPTAATGKIEIRPIVVLDV